MLNIKEIRYEAEPDACTIVVTCNGSYTVLGNGTFVSASATRAKATGISYYVDSVNGNDDNDGTSETTAWKSLEKVNATTFKPGDKFRFREAVHGADF